MSITGFPLFCFLQIHVTPIHAKAEDTVKLIGPLLMVTVVLVSTIMRACGVNLIVSYPNIILTQRTNYYKTTLDVFGLNCLNTVVIQEQNSHV